LKNKLATLICGFGAGVLQITPIIKSFTCCLIIPAAAILALYLDQKATKSIEKLEIKKAVIFGLLTGLFAAVFGSFFELMITFITRTNDIVGSVNQIQEFYNSMNSPMFTEAVNMVLKMSEEIKETGFSTLYTIIILVNNFLVNPIFGLLGGLLGYKLINRSKNLIQ